MTGSCPQPGGSLHVRRHAVTISHTGSAPPSPTAVQQALTGQLQGRLAEALAALGGPAGYWVVRRLAVRAVVSCTWSSHALAGEVARATARSVAAVLRRGDDGDGVRWWPDRPAYLADVLRDAADGRARDRWEYAQFAEQLAQPSSLLVQVAQAEPEHLLQALLGFDDPTLLRVVLSADPSTTGDVLAATGGRAPADPRRDLVLAATARLARSGRLPTDRRAAVLLAVVAARSGAALADVLGPASDVGELLEALARTGSSTRRLLDALAAGQWSVAVGVLGSSRADTALALVPWSAAERQELRRALVSAPPPLDGAGTVSVPLGGAFVLLLLVDELCDWPAVTAGWPAPLDVAPSRVARLVVVATALGAAAGGEQSLAETAPAVADPVLRLALGIPEAVDLERLTSWCALLTEEHAAQLDAALPDAQPPQPDGDVRLPAALRVLPCAVVERAADALLRSLARRLPGMAHASAAYLRRNVLDVDATVTLEPQRVVVELGRPPLQVLLAITGVGSGTLRPESDPERTWTVTTRG